MQQSLQYFVAHKVPNLSPFSLFSTFHQFMAWWTSLNKKYLKIQWACKMTLLIVIVSGDTTVLVACMFEMDFIFVCKHKSAQKTYFSLSYIKVYCNNNYFNIFTVFKQLLSIPQRTMFQ